ncbi:phage integrase SAM-like domain-containing protein [Polaribacter sp. IC073]|uniref:phage integrase SAM-like domain-containing protein n=1 Tax=Polaribacter sp. IC073 TaxID=2508540 RepID=UPI00397BB520
MEYLQEDCELSPNTIGKHLKNIKMFMNSAVEDAVTDCIGHRQKHFKVIREEIFKFILC